ncbi:MAG TPA: hypothetical protein VEY67_11875 [Candidatus Dormibacteraeota bacterium]|nr:hypothetical protein [Candidatus Dormibacteraeota bacterium]
MSFAPTRTVGSQGAGMLPSLLTALVLLVLLVGVSAHLLASSLLH